MTITLYSPASFAAACAASACFMAAAHVEKTFKRRLQDGLVRITVSKVLAKTFGVGKSALAAVVCRPRRHPVQVFVNPVVGTQPFPLRGVV